MPSVVFVQADGADTYYPQGLSSAVRGYFPQKLTGVRRG